MSEWISVKDRLPNEHDSIFRELKGTSRWDPFMSESISDVVIVAIKFQDGSSMVKTARTKDGKWWYYPFNKYLPPQYAVVTHWMPLPEPPPREDLVDEQV